MRGDNPASLSRDRAIEQSAPLGPCRDAVLARDIHQYITGAAKGTGMKSGIKIMLAALALLALPGPAHAAAPTPVRIEVPSASNRQFFALWVAIGSGAFAKEGLAPQILVADSPRDTGQLLLGGNADVALLPPPMFLGMMAENKPIRLFASLLAGEPINLVARADVARARGLSLDMSLGARLRAMKGLRIGLAVEVAPRLRATFAAAGMKADEDAKLITIDGPDQVAAFEKGDVDVLFAHTPYLETVLVQDHAVLIADTSGGEVAALADGQIHALATTDALARAKPRLIAAVHRAIDRGLKLIHADPNQAVKALIAYGGVGADRAQLEAIVAIYRPAVPRNSNVSLDGIRRDATLYPAHPVAPDFGKTDPADFAVPGFIARQRNPNKAAAREATAKR
jgi:ABC-type nitrate/sulfonate/bicarbonate transport system substrate-binding protein